MFFINPLSYLTWKSQSDRSSAESPFEFSNQDFLHSTSQPSTLWSHRQAIKPVERVHQVYPLERRLFP